jgi:hypothetical protein
LERKGMKTPPNEPFLGNRCGVCIIEGPSSSLKMVTPVPQLREITPTAG